MRRQLNAGCFWVILGVTVASSPSRAWADDSSFATHLDRAHALLAAGQDEAAISELEAALSLREDANVYCDLGKIHQWLGHLPQAYHAYQRCIDGADIPDAERSRLRALLLLLPQPAMPSPEQQLLQRGQFNRRRGIALMSAGSVLGAVTIAVAIVVQRQIPDVQGNDIFFPPALIRGIIIGHLAGSTAAMLGTGIPFHLIGNRQIARARNAPPSRLGIDHAELRIGPQPTFTLQF